MSLIASLALLGATASAAATYGSTASTGSAHVVNKCNYDVVLCNTPASGGGYEQIDKTLKPGESYEQAWTQLSNDNGWSIKLYKDETKSSVLQYEYTFHGDGIIWYDLSCVDGNPWDKDWEITSNGTDCNPKQQAYRYSTDDAYGMQSCPQASAITVTLCTGVSQDNGDAVDEGSSREPASPAASSAPAYEAAPSVPEAVTPPAYVAPTYNFDGDYTPPAYVAPTYNFDGDYTGPAATPTTLSTAVKNDGAVTVTEMATAYVTAEVTAYADKKNRRRHEHHPRHAHNA